MPESFTPREINDYINSHNNGPKFDPYGSEELSSRLRATQAEGGDIFAQTQHSIDEDNATKAEIEAKKEQARQALANFRSYLEQNRFVAKNALPSDDELEYNYNTVTQDCEITRRDGEPIVLEISRSGLTGELPLPPQLMVTELNCLDNQLTRLPELPKSLTVLRCSLNQLTRLPDLPESLIELECKNNGIIDLPDRLPESLNVLNCSSNPLTRLPDLPESLIGLICSGSFLLSLPELPDSLTEIRCGGNFLTSLPVLPVRLTRLWCNNNKLTSLPELPISLAELNCEGNDGLANNATAQAALQALKDRGVTVIS